VVLTSDEGLLYALKNGDDGHVSKEDVCERMETREGSKKAKLAL
jgi:hypothetical protein